VSDYRVESLVDYPQFIPTLAAWHHAQWSYLDLGKSVAQRAAALRTHLRNAVPMTVVARSAAGLLGSASLIAHDMDTRMELSPWLASVYVAPAHRHKGVGSALVREIASRATALGFSTLYLFTPDRAPFYERLGWQVLEHVKYRGYEQVLMSVSLRLPQQASR
jgi:predicted N-acetyltransferase YhbS